MRIDGAVRERDAQVRDIAVAERHVANPADLPTERHRYPVPRISASYHETLWHFGDFGAYDYRLEVRAEAKRARIVICSIPPSTTIAVCRRTEPRHPVTKNRTSKIRAAPKHIQ